MRVSFKFRMVRGAVALSGFCLAMSGIAHAQERIDVWSEFSDELRGSIFQEIVDDFNASQDDVEVVHTGYENTPYETTLKTSFSVATLPTSSFLTPGR